MLTRWNTLQSLKIIRATQINIDGPHKYNPEQKEEVAKESHRMMLRIKLEIMSNNSIFCLGIHKFVVEIEKNAWKDEHKIKNASFLRAVGKGFLGDSVVKNPPANVGDVGSIPGSGRSPGGGNGNLLQYSGLENP